MSRLHCVLRSFWLAAAVALLAANLTCGNPDSTKLSGSGNAGRENRPQAESADDCIAALLQHLLYQGWNENAARAVVQLNERFMRLVWEEDRDQWHKTIALWNRLANNASAQHCLQSLPELASLLAGSLESKPDGPELIIKSIPKETDEQHIVLSLYGMFCEASDATRLAEALLRDGDLIVELCRRGGLDVAVTWFLISHQDDEPGKTYRLWLREVFRQALKDGDEALGYALAMLDIHAPAIQRLLRQNPDFAAPFRERYWPRFSRKLDEILKSKQFEDDSERAVVWNCWVIDARVWEYYHRFACRGNYIFDAFDRWGHLAVDWALAPEYQDEQLINKVFDSLQYADEPMIKTLANPNLRSNPLFRRLLKRELPPGVMAKAISALGDEPAKAPRLLDYWDGLSDSALKEEFGPPREGVQTWIPGYGIYYMLRKSAQGRDIGWTDAFQAAADIVTIPAALSAPAAAPFRQGLTRQLAKAGIKQGAAQAGKASARTLAPLAIRQFRSQVPRQILNRAGGSLFQIDVTQPAKLSFKMLQEFGLGRKTFKALTGAEARIFMRSDGRVAFHLGDLFRESSALGVLLGETATNAGFDTAMEVHAVKNVVAEAIKTAQEAPDLVEKQLLAWREHLSVWWTAVHTGALDRALQSAEKTDQVNK